MELTPILIGAAAGVAIGAGVAYLIFTKMLSKKAIGIIKEAEDKGENIKQAKLLQAKEKFLSLKEEHGKEIKDRNRKLQSAEDRIKSKESQLSKQLEQSKRKEKEVDGEKEKLALQVSVVEKKKTELDKAHQRSVTVLEELSGISKDEATAKLLEELKADARVLGSAQAQEIIDEAKLTANQQAKKIIIQSIQ
ncbi:MAG: ribonuclease Y, partial [Flavobacteriales bacterium]